MDSNWSLYVAGVGSLDAAKNLLANFVTKLRDTGLKVTHVMPITGEIHLDAMRNVETTENGWTLYAFGEGDITKAYGMLPDFLDEFKSEGIDVRASNIGVGRLVEDIPGVPTTA